MPEPTMDITGILQGVQAGDDRALASLMPLVYNELRAIARGLLQREHAGHTLQATALVNEAYLKLVNIDEPDFKGRAHFFAIAAQVMRRILIDHARTARAEKRPPRSARAELTDSVAWAANRADELLVLDEALERLAALDSRQARVVEMRFFGGLEREEIAEVLGVSLGTVKRDWTLARAWLEREMRNSLGA
jgi:RNA polymerase sigma factor (TIGR02999 family)